ncbi:MAG: Na+/H+ antiporter NhaC family protein [Firmicutes bacterium]|nr:Na+/H+ antiporter NhaC family protein [Bacillota bacterium]
MAKEKKKYTDKICFALIVLIFFVVCMIQAPISGAVGSLWSLLPPIVAIGLALITKEVYSSLFIGVITGGVIYSIATDGGFEGVLNVIIKDGLTGNLSDPYNVGILIFLVVLGIIVVLMNKAGGSRAYGEWAVKHIKSRGGACFSTFLLGVLIFVDDYFNCLTVGSVMRPVTDKYKISRAKLAYFIDATAAPVCIIAPISSWAAAVSGTVDGVNGIKLFISTIPYNLYALLTLVMVTFLCFNDIDYGPMKAIEARAKEGDLFDPMLRVNAEDVPSIGLHGSVLDLILPVIILIVCCITGMIYTGGIFSGETFVNAFANCDAAYGLSMGSIFALILIIIYFLIRRTLTFHQMMESVVDGFKQMVPAIMILTFAWTLKTMTNLLEAGAFVSGLVANAMTIKMLLPVILFAVAIGLSFATGTSWGTFGILIPIVTNVFAAELSTASETGNIPAIVVICISACLAGAVCGDHCSPISDTTIMASTGAQCDHVTHVSTQLPYAFTVAGVCAVGYIIAGFVQNAVAVLGISVAAMLAVLFAVKYMSGKKTQNSTAEK